jgi:hypothetical protein
MMNNNQHQFNQKADVKGPNAAIVVNLVTQKPIVLPSMVVLIAITS